MEYRTVILEGTFDHSKEVMLGPRTALNAQVSLHSSARSGFNVITPFHLKGRDEVILVNRGWIPSDKLDSETRKQGQVTGEVSVSGLVRLQEKKMFLAGSGIASPDCPCTFYNLRDVAHMAREAGCSPYFVELDDSTTVPGGPIGGQTRVTLLNLHTSYIITWFALAVATGYLWYKRFRRAPPPMSALAYMRRRVHSQQ